MFEYVCPFNYARVYSTFAGANCRALSLQFPSSRLTAQDEQHQYHRHRITTFFPPKLKSNTLACRTRACDVRQGYVLLAPG
jgi:hypothetical protein